jgi:hypothetical protein
MNGKHGDHPLTDILVYNLTVFGDDIDAVVKKLSRLMPGPELEALINWFQPPPRPRMKQILEDILNRKQKEARERGWELEKDE